MSSVRAEVPRDREAILAEVLTPRQAIAFRVLSLHDQAHLCRVYRWLQDRGVTDPDLLVAALLHDLGKVSSAGRVRLADRVARVVLARLAPGVLARLARLPAPRWRHGLALAVHHPALGAAQAAELGCSPHTCWLIAHHEDADPRADSALALLAEADRAAE